MLVIWMYVAQCVLHVFSFSALPSSSLAPCVCVCVRSLWLKLWQSGRSQLELAAGHTQVTGTLMQGTETTQCADILEALRRGRVHAQYERQSKSSSNADSEVSAASVQDASVPRPISARPGFLAWAGRSIRLQRRNSTITQIQRKNRKAHSHRCTYSGRRCLSLSSNSTASPILKSTIEAEPGPVNGCSLQCSRVLRQEQRQPNLSVAGSSNLK